MEPNSNLKSDIVKEIHEIFLNSMEARYKEVLSFLGFLLPALTAFIWLSYNFNINQNLFKALKNNNATKELSSTSDSCKLNNDSSSTYTSKIIFSKDSSSCNVQINIKNKSNQQNLKETKGDSESIIFTFFLGTLVILFILTWGAVYALAVSYRYRYLQASVYLIEETTGANNYIPSSFKPKPINSFKKRIFLDISPSILQVNIHFFALSIIGISFIFSYLTIVNNYYFFSSLLSFFSILFLSLIYFIGGWRYPKKMQRIIKDLDDKLGIIKKEEKGINILMTK